MSEREPELGLGRVAAVDPHARRISVAFPATGEQRLYALGTPVLKRVMFRAGETVVTHAGAAVVVSEVEEAGGLLTYVGAGGRVREDELSDITSVSSPPERLLAGQIDPAEVFELRLQALQAQARFRQSEVRGFLGGRLELLPHQFYILHEVARRQVPRVLLADEVGLGKTIEACLILQRLLAVGQARRVLILVPESLTHQWFVELLRRFNLWFSIYDEERCVALEESDPGANPFLSSQLALADVEFVSGDERRRDQAVAAGWDILVVDEAHHLTWTPEEPGYQYALVEQLARSTPGVLLLTATPTQLGLAGHFARLRLLDPHRYGDFAAFATESQRYAAVAAIAEKIVEEKPLTAGDRETLQQIFNRDPARLAQHLRVVDERRPGAHPQLLRTLLDQHGTGRVVFRNTRAAMSGFPKRKFLPVALELRSGVVVAPAREGDDAAAAAGQPLAHARSYEEEGGGGGDGRPRAVSPAALLARVARELQAEEGGTAEAIRYSFRDDPRIEWLVGLLKERRREKILLICKSLRKVAAIEAALQEKMAVKSGLFHEGLALVQRDRNAAWFAEPDGAQILLCSEIGSEGRNFQFAHHLVLFDLPLNPGLLEQRIGRLDRIGQTDTIQIHVPYLVGSSDEVLVAWYHRGLDAFEAALQGGNEYQDAFSQRVLTLALAFGDDPAHRRELETLLAATVEFRVKLSRQLREGRDRLLELHSFDRPVADRVIARIREADADPFLRHFLVALLDHFGVRIKEHEEGDVFLDPAHAYIEGFPSIPADGMLATFDRRRATTREDIRFISADHALVQDAIDLLIDSPTGTTAFGVVTGDAPGMLLEGVFVLETVADTRWHVDQFLAPTPVRTVVDVRGEDVTAHWPPQQIKTGFAAGDIHRFLEQPGFDAAALKHLVAAAEEAAEIQSDDLKTKARERAALVLGADIQRLIDLQKVNDHIRPEEIALANEQLTRTGAAIAQARLRLDSIRLLLVSGPPGRRR